MSRKTRKMLYLLAPGVILALIFYAIIPLTSLGADTGLQSGICLSIILILFGGIIGGMHTSDRVIDGSMYGEKVMAHGTEAVRKQNRKLLIPLMDLGTYIAGTGALLLFLGIIAYILVKG